MKQVLVGAVLGTLLIALGFVFRPYLLETEQYGPYILVGLCWVMIFTSLAWFSTPFSANLVISTGICLPMIAYLFNHWIGYAVGAAVVYGAMKWAEKL